MAWQRRVWSIAAIHRGACIERKSVVSTSTNRNSNFLKTQLDLEN